jgi:dTDP-glucose 4,6-dehydratase
MKKYLVTGGAGFIGSNYINALYSKLDLLNVDFEIHCIDKLTYAARLENIDLAVRNSERFIFHQIDINSKEVSHILESNKFAYCINFAAESHVDRSIEGPLLFFHTNVLGTANLLNSWKETQETRFIQIGTDEVYGSLDTGYANEMDPLRPSSPYSASKAGADLLALSFKYTFGLDVVVTRCSNNYGPNQNSEKFIPKMIGCIKAGVPLGVYGNGMNIREWIHVMDHVSALMLIADAESLKSDIYNIGSNLEKTNIEVIELLKLISNEADIKVNFISDRLGHDYRYALDSSKIDAELGWKPKFAFEAGLKELFFSL